MRRSIYLLLATLVCGAVQGSALTPQIRVPDPKPIIWARMPSLSPDGKKLAFVYKGDIWLADSAGGRATPLTRNVAPDEYPQFSPDGKWIAFASMRTGNWDIFMVPAEGGDVKQVTCYSEGEIASGWTPDGKSVLFCEARDTTDQCLFTLDVSTLRLRKLAQDFAYMDTPNFSPDGKLVVYGRLGFSWIRPRYNGSRAMRVWLLNTTDGTRRCIINDDKQHLWTRFLPDGKTLLTVTYGEATPSSHKLKQTPKPNVDTAARTPNLWLFDLDGKGRQVSHFVGGSVRFPTIAARTGDIAFEYEHDLYLLKAGEKEPAKINLFASDDSAQNTLRHETVTTGAAELAASPDGKTFAFGIKSDIWTVPVDRPKGVAGRDLEIARRLTDWAGEDTDFHWSPDGAKLYFRSDREENFRLFEMDVATLEVKPLWTRPESVGELHVSPDGKQLAFWTSGVERGLFAFEPATGTIKKVVSIPEDHPTWQGGGDVSWSPDMRWIAYTFGESNGAWNIWIKPAAGGKAVNVTRLNAAHSQPTWSPDGKYLFFQSNRELDGSGSLYVIPLTKETELPSEVDIKYEKPKGGVQVKIDFDDITSRIRKFSTMNPDGNLTVTPDGRIMFVSGGDIWSINYDGKDAKRLTSGGGYSNFRLFKNTNKAYAIRNGDVMTVTLDDNSKQEKVDFTAEWDHDLKADRHAAFIQFWRAYNESFYDPYMHRRDWAAIRKRYEPMLDGVETNADFATLLGMMVGELESSHSEIGAASDGIPSAVTPHLGFTFDYGYDGPGIRVDTVPDGVPGAFEQTRIKPGEYVMAINGHDVTTDENLYRLINDKQGRVFTFLVNSKPTKDGARTVRYTSLALGDFAKVVTQNRYRRLQKYVEEKSKGKIAYVHIAGFGGNDQTIFDREVYEYSLGKDAIIIDVRWNGGGNVSDHLIDWIERKPHGYYQGRNAEPVVAPNTAWTIPTLVLMNQISLSNAEMFVDAMRTRGLAKLVGMPTPGYVIWTGGLNLLDGTHARMPGSGVYRLDGTPMEDMGEQPDFRVDLSPQDWLAERDPQLDKALEILMK